MSDHPALRHPVRIVSASSLFDGHDAAINIMRRIMQTQGAEVIHLGHNRSVQEVVDAAIEGVVAINCGLDMKPFGTGVARGVAATGKPTAAFVLDAPGVDPGASRGGRPARGGSVRTSCPLKPRGAHPATRNQGRSRRETASRFARRPLMGKLLDYR